MDFTFKNGKVLIQLPRGSIGKNTTQINKEELLFNILLISLLRLKKHVF